MAPLLFNFCCGHNRLVLPTSAGSLQHRPFHSTASPSSVNPTSFRSVTAAGHRQYSGVQIGARAVCTIKLLRAVECLRAFSGSQSGGMRVADESAFHRTALSRR